MVKGKKSGEGNRSAQRYIAGAWDPQHRLSMYFHTPSFFNDMSDSRFDRLRTDPRFRRPRKKHSKVVVDERFKGLFTQKKKRKSGVPFSLIDGFN
jgi:hypothetical protein